MSVLGDRPGGWARRIGALVTVAPGDHPFECSSYIQLGQVGTMTMSA